MERERAEAEAVVVRGIGRQVPLLAVPRQRHATKHARRAEPVPVRGGGGGGGEAAAFLLGDLNYRVTLPPQQARDLLAPPSAAALASSGRSAAEHHAAALARLLAADPLVARPAALFHEGWKAVLEEAAFAGDMSDLSVARILHTSFTAATPARSRS